MHKGLEGRDRKTERCNDDERKVDFKYNRGSNHRSPFQPVLRVFVVELYCIPLLRSLLLLLSDVVYSFVQLSVAASHYKL